MSLSLTWKFWRACKAFTLMEMLVSLLITGLLFHSLSTIFNSYSQIEDYLRSTKHNDFLHFMSVFEAELKHYELVEVRDKELVVQNQSIFYFELANNKIYKKPGHQILLYNVNDWQLKSYHSILKVEVLFENGEDYKGYLPLGEAYSQ